MSLSRLSRLALLALAMVACGNSPANEHAPPADGTAVPAQADLAQVRQAIERVDVQWEDAANRGDAAGVAALYTEDGWLLPPNSDMVQGRENVQQVIQGLIDMGLRSVEFTSVDVGASGELAYEVGRYSLDIQPPGAGEPVTDEGKYVIVARRQRDGGWKIVADIFNSSLPAANASQ